jgi:hypothetical protein
VNVDVTDRAALEKAADDVVKHLSVAPMMDWTDDPRSNLQISNVCCGQSASQPRDAIARMHLI